MTSELRPALAVWEADRELTIAALHAWAEHIGAGYSCPAAAQTMLMAATIMQADREAVRAEPEAAPVEPVAWKNYAPDGDWWLTDEREPADSCDYSVPLYAHPPAAPTDALVEKAREWAIVVREADKQWSQPLSTLLEQLAAALAAMQEAKQ